MVDPKGPKDPSESITREGSGFRCRVAVELAEYPKGPKDAIIRYSGLG